MLLVLWYKDDQLAPILTLDGRKNSADSSATISLPYLQGRAFFTAHGRPAHLLIDPVAASDEGDYRCRVDFRKARTVNTVISLKVITPPQVPKILDVDGNPLSGVVGPYNEGDELTLRCLTKGGKPRPSLIWWRDYAIIDDSFEFDDRDATTNELTTTLVRHHLLALVMCQAINSNITTPASTSITLDINLKPLEVRITQLTPILVSGSEALFECNTAGSRPMPAIYWIFNGQKYETRIHGEQQTTSTLTLRMDRTHRGLVLECVVENLRIPSSTIRDQLTLDVQYAPQLSLHLGTPSLSLSTVQEGMDIYFDCHVDSNPPPTTPITWLFNGQPLLPEPGVIESNQSLVLQRVPRWRNGTYQCQCANHQGTVISNTIDLEVKFAPVCRTTNTLIFGLNLGELVQISCDVDARPEKVSFSWKFERTTNLANFVQINDTKSLLEYQPRLRDQFGLIECTAKNDIGMQREPCRYLIAPLAGPFFPYNCAVANQSDSTLSIRCDGSIATNTSAEAADNPGHFRPSAAADLDDQEEEDAEGEDAEETADQRIKYHPQKARRKYPEPPHHHSSSSSSNLSTSDIYALYFAPDNEEQQTAAAAAAEEDVDSGSGQRPGSPTKMTYRNGGPLGSLAAPGKMSQHQLTASASLLLNELVPKFNSYSINSSPHLFAYPPTYYVCEIYALLPRMTLIKNVTIDAVGRRIMNPLNGSFSFLVDALPPNTPLRVNIYARNARKRSPVAVELEARTLRAAERRIDYAQQGGGEHHSGGGGGDSLAARGRKASFFEELYGGYGRFRSKHLVVGLLIGAVAVAVFVAILLIVIASIRNKTDTGGGRHLQGQETRLSSFDAGGGGGGGKQKMGRKMAGRESSLRHSATLHLEDFKETAFMTTTDEETGEALHGGTVVTCSGNAQSKCSSSQLHSSTTLQHDIVPGGTAAAIYGDYAHYGGLDGDDDSSMRSDHQLIQQASNTLESSTAINSSNNSSNGSKSYYHHHRSRGPPSYFDLEQSVGQSHHLTSDTSVPRAFVNLISSPVGSAGTVGTAVVEAKPDLIQTATIYSNAGAKDPSSAIFDTISFESHHGTAPESATASAGTAYLNELGPTMIAVTGEQISGNIIHFSSPMRKFEPNTATVLTSAHGHGTLHRRYIGHSYLANDGPSPSSSSSNATTSSLFATLPRGTSGASTNAVLSSAHAHLSGSNMLIDAGNKQQQSYIYIQHLAGPETESPANDGT